MKDLKLGNTFRTYLTINAIIIERRVLSIINLEDIRKVIDKFTVI